MALLTSNVKTVIVQNNLPEYKKIFGKINNAYTKAGYISETGVAPGDINELSEMVLIAVYHEFGTSKMPARATLGPGFTKNKQLLKVFVASQYRLIVMRKIDVKTALGKIGEYATSLVKKEIVDLDYPPLAPATIKKKGSSKPLIDTAQMLNSVNHAEVIN